MAEKFDRNQFKATSVAELKKLKTQEDVIVGTGGSKEYIKIEKGVNKIRLAPKFPTEKDFYLMRCVHWASLENKDGKMGRVPILNSKIHGGTKLDVFESYIEFASQKLSDTPDKVKILTDYEKGGIHPVITWQAYGWLLKKDQKPKFGIYEFKKSVRDQINSLCIIEDEDEAIEVDPFTDVDEGKPILLTYDPEQKDKKNFHKIQIAKNAFPLTEEMFEELLSKEPLTKIMRGVYGMEDFERACEAIRNFDIENEFDLFDDADFQETLALIKAQYTVSKEKKSSKQEDKKVDKKSTKKIETKVEDEDDEDEEEEKPTKKSKGDKFDAMDREELKEFISEEELEIVVKKSHSDDDIRNNIRAVVNTKKVETVEEDEDETEEDEDDEPVITKTKKAKEEEVPKKKLTVEELRAKLKADKKK